MQTSESDRSQPAGDIAIEEFRDALARAGELISDYLTRLRELPVTPAIEPGALRRRLPSAPPEQPEPLDAILADYQTLIEPASTHWNHPGFLAYFSSSSCGPAIIAELLAAGLNVNAMLWQTGPAQTELELHVCDWLRQMIGLPDAFTGHINDTASIASLLALAAARYRTRPDATRRGVAAAGGPLTVYCSDQAHSSIDKAVVLLGLGLEHLRRIESDGDYRMRVDALEARIRADRAAGCVPIAVVATAGTTSTTSIDPLDAIARVCERERLWLHVDAAMAGSGLICPELRPLCAGIERADSIVVNPHKWLFVPLDCSVLFVRDLDAWREAFRVVPAYLHSEAEAINLMDLGVQLGRRFRALKLWFTIRRFGVEGLRQRLRQHVAWAREFASWVDASDAFERVAPAPLNTVCFRAVWPGMTAERADALNERLLHAVNATGRVYLSHTKLRGRYVLRLSVGNVRTTRDDVEQAWRLLVEKRAELA